MSTDVRSYLESKGLVLKRGSHENYHTACFFHGEDPGDRGRLYVNTDPDADIPGLYKCFVCDAKGSLVTLKKYFGDEVREVEEDTHMRREIFEAAAAYYHDELADHPDVFKWLRGEERMLTIDTIVEHQLGYADGGLYQHLKAKGYRVAEMLATGLVVEDPKTNRIVDSLYKSVTIPYTVAGNVTSIRGRAWPYEKGDQRGKYKTCGGNTARLFGSDETWHTDEIVVCEGELDALVMRQLGFNAVASPGANVWQDSWDAYLHGMKRIWLVFDQDDAGEKGADKLIKKFGARIKRIRLEHNGIPCDPTEWVARGHSRDEFIKLQRAAATGGLLVTVDEALAEHSEYQNIDGLKIGYELFDERIHPGLLPSQVMVLLAKTGVGKTVWLLNTMHMMCMTPGQEDKKILLLSLEQTRGEWWERARRIYRFHNIMATDRDALDFWRDRLLIVDKNRVNPDELNTILEDYEYRMGVPPDCVMIDYLGYWSRSFGGEAYQRTSDAIMMLKEIAKDRRVPIITPHQVSRMAKNGEEPEADAARDTGVIEETADFLLTLWNPDTMHAKQDEEKNGLVNMRIGKSRHGGRGAKFTYQFAPISLAMVPLGHSLASRARDEIGYERDYNDRFDQAVHRHRTGFKKGHLEPKPGYQERMP